MSMAMAMNTASLLRHLHSGHGEHSDATSLTYHNILAWSIKYI
jgi:hypothetical protein